MAASVVASTVKQWPSSSSWLAAQGAAVTLGSQLAQSMFIATPPVLLPMTSAWFAQKSGCKPLIRIAVRVG